MKSNHNLSAINRREFVSSTLATAIVGPLVGSVQASDADLRLEAGSFLGGLESREEVAPIQGAKWFVASKVGDGIAYRFPQGTLRGAKMLSSDMLLDGDHMIVFRLTLQEGEGGRALTFRFSGLNQCSFRVRMPLSLVDQNRWGIEREGAFLKPRCGGDRIDPAKVDRMQLAVFRKSPAPARWCMTPVVVNQEEVARIEHPVLPKGPLLDELGQSTLHDWPGKSRSQAEVVKRIRSQLREAPSCKWPGSFSRWGGWKDRRVLDGSGFFRTYNDGKRWWLVDPDGFAHWSVGLDCVRVDTFARFDGLEAALTWRPDPKGEFREIYDFGKNDRRGKSVNYLAANLIRAFGAQGWRNKWSQIALAELRRLGFNTVGNWSEWNFARTARFPYVRPLRFSGKRTKNVYRDFPDVFHSDFAQDVADFAAQLSDTAEDPAFLGYFLMNEPTWGFSSELPAAGMLFTSASCETRKELSRFLKKQYLDSQSLSDSWGIKTSFEEIASGRWDVELPENALKDLKVFSSVMVEHYFEMLSTACKAVDPNHLNLGMRWAGLPPEWAVRGMKSFDVFSLNCYREKLPRETSEEIHRLLDMPVLVGEWHFGALDVGLPSSGIGHLWNQRDRAKAYRVYFEDAAANPNCVGVHWFTLYDESALGRFDGENYNIGFLDVCNRPYDELTKGATRSHERVYQLAEGNVAPFSDVPEYLPKLF